MNKPVQVQKSGDDQYVHGMDWPGQLQQKDFQLPNYRKYQFDLIGKHIGRNILEVGSGDRGFTNQIVKNVSNINQLLSTEPSLTLLDLHKNNFQFPDFVRFEAIDLFDMTPEKHGRFDTIIFIHVLEHIEKDRAALDHIHSLLEPGGKILIEVPAMPFLFSVHDEMLGHYRRYNKKNFRAMVNNDLYKIHDLWFQDEIGMIGSFIFFKMRKIKLKSEAGASLVKNQGSFYDKYVIPFEKFYERFLRFPFGLSLTGILEKK